MPGAFKLGDRYDWRRHAEVQGLKARPLRKEPTRYNSGPTPRHAILDLVALIRESVPEVQDYIFACLG